MARRRKIRKAHPRLFKYLTIFGATLGIVCGTAFSVCMAVDAVKGDIITDELREYEIGFSSEGSLISKNVYKRGEEFTPPENPTHSLDGESNYFFIGWDTNGNGIPDFVPPRAYYSFNAEAVYFRTGKFDMDLLDLLNLSPEDLMKLLQDLNIDWELFMSMFNISPEDLLNFLMGTAILTYETVPSNSQYPVYFRSTSFGNFDYKKMCFDAPSFYDSNNISNNSVNPLSFTSYKLQRLDELGMLPTGFGFTQYDIKYNATQDYYPIPDCAYGDDLNELSNSDAHYEVQPVDNQLTAYSAYCPAFGYVIDLFKMIPLTGAAARDEKAYYQYALDNYTAVPDEYKDILDDMIYDPDNNWYEDTNGNELWQVDSIASYVSKLGTCNVFSEEGGIDYTSIMGNKKESFDPIKGLLEKKEGSPYDFNTTATLLFRRLNIPARLVKGYINFPGSPLGNTITLYHEHYWCEIYVAGTGWMICDCIDPSAVTGTNPYEQLDKSNTPLQNKHILERINVREPANTEYFIGDVFNYADGYLTAYFQDGETSRLYFTSSGVTVSGFDSTEVGPCKVTVSYTYEGVTKSDSFYVTIKDKTNKIVRVDFDFTTVKYEYYVGENFDYPGVVATARYQDGTEKDVSPLVTYTGFPTGTKGTEGVYEITAGYFTDETADLDNSLKSAVYNITIFKKKVTSITFGDNGEDPMTKISYYQGEEINYDGLTYYFHYYDGTSELGKGAVVYDGPSTSDMTVVGSHDVTIMYTNDKPGDGEVFATFQIEVTSNGMTALEISNYKDSYMVGQIFNIYDCLSSASIVVKYLKTDPVNLSVSDLTVVGDLPNMLTAGTKVITLRYTNSNNDVINGAISISVVASGGVINLSYSIADYAQFTYDGNAHDVTITPQLPSDWPSHLTLNLGKAVSSYVGGADDGMTISLFRVQPSIISITTTNGDDVTSQYSYTLGTGAEGVNYFVSPRAATVTLIPPSTPAKPNDSFTIGYQVSGLAGGDSVQLINDTYSFPSVGIYNNYPTEVRIIRGGNDVTGCYSLSIVRNNVEIRNQL